MQQKLQMVEFGVAELAREDEGPAMVWQTRRQVGIEVEDRRRGRRCS